MADIPKSPDMQPAAPRSEGIGRPSVVAEPSTGEISRRNFLLGRLTPGNPARQNLEQAARARLDQVASAVAESGVSVPNVDSTAGANKPPDAVPATTTNIETSEVADAQSLTGSPAGVTEVRREEDKPPAGAQSQDAGAAPGETSSVVTDEGEDAGKDEGKVAAVDAAKKDSDEATSDTQSKQDDKSPEGSSTSVWKNPDYGKALSEGAKGGTMWVVTDTGKPMLKQVEVTGIGSIIEPVPPKEPTLFDKAKDILSKLKQEERTPIETLIKEQQEAIGALTKQTEVLTSQITNLEATNSRLEQTIARLEQRLTGGQTTGEAQAAASAGDGQTAQVEGAQPAAPPEGEQPATATVSGTGTAEVTPAGELRPAEGVVTSDQATEPVDRTAATEAPTAQNSRAESARNRELLRAKDKEAIGALNYTFEFAKDLYNKNELTPHERWLFESAQAAMGVIDKKGNKYTFTSNIDESQKISQEEGVPVEGLFEIINERMQSGQISEEVGNKLFQQMTILAGNSYRYIDIAGRLPDENPQMFQARLRQEIVYIQGNPIRNTGSESGNRKLAERTLLGRAEFIPPSKKAARVVGLPSAAPQQEAA